MISEAQKRAQKKYYEKNKITRNRARAGYNRRRYAEMARLAKLAIMHGLDKGEIE